MIDLTPYSIQHPIQVSEDEYDQLVQKKEGGWSQCESSLEMLGKLHYLRLGFDAGKIQESDFVCTKVLKFIHLPTIAQCTV